MKRVIFISLTLSLSLCLCSIAQAQHGMRIERIHPVIVEPGATIEIRGTNLGHTGNRGVFMARIAGNRPTTFTRLNEVRWVNGGLVQVRMPADLPASSYLLKIENDDSLLRGRSNVEIVRVSTPRRDRGGNTERSSPSLYPAWPSTMIDRISADGEALLIQGRNFGANQGRQNVTIHQNHGQRFWHQALQILSWEGARIRAQMPARLGPGEYFVVVDQADGLGSNSMELNIPGSSQAPRPGGAGPDLIITEFSITPATPVQGAPVSVRVFVYNQGNQHTGPFTVQWWPSENNRAPAKTWNVDGIRARGERVLTFTYDGYPSWYGQIRTKVVVDASGAVLESEERNNTRVMTISVRRP